MYRPQILLLLLLMVFSCRQTNKDTITSPSKRYKLQYDINVSHNDEKTFGCIKLTLFDASGQLLSTIQTGASNYSKWAISWDPHDDTIILNSHDIGISAYRIADNKNIKEITITPQLSKLADSIFNKKYDK